MAQLDSASDSDSDGWRFESVWVRHSKTFAICKGLFLLTKRILYLLLTASKDKSSALHLNLSRAADIDDKTAKLTNFAVRERLTAKQSIRIIAFLKKRKPQKQP